MNSYLLTLIMWISIWLISPSVSYAEGWRIVSHPNYPPYDFEDESGQPTGLDTELVKAVMEYLNIEYSITFVPWKRVVHMTEKNALDLSFQFQSS